MKDKKNITTPITEDEDFSKEEALLVEDYEEYENLFFMPTDDELEESCEVANLLMSIYNS